MEKIAYREAVFNVVRTLSYERTPVKDAAGNYLWTNHNILVEVHWHPTQVSYKKDPAGLVPVAEAGKMPGETDLALLTRILQPRGRLVVTAGGRAILDTPDFFKGSTTRMSTDATGGPRVELASVPMMIGQKHWVCTLRFTADVRDQVYLLDNFQNAIVSNLWVATEDVDFQRRSVRRFAGRAILRADVMRMGTVNANTFRDLYLFPCPDHYQRQNVQVQLSEDGTVCDWSFEDAMRGYDLGATSPIVDIECYRTAHVRAGSPMRALTDTTRATARDIANFDFFGAGMNALGRVFDNTINNLPKSWMQVRCDLTGDRNADLGKLTGIALGVVMNQVGLNIAQLMTGVAELTFIQDVADKVYTSVDLTVEWTDDVTLFAGAGLALAGHPGFVDVVLNSGSAQTIRQFLTDSRQLGVAAGFGAGTGLPNAGIAASRDGAYNTNPPLNQGAFPIAPSPAAPNTAQGVSGAPSAQPTGRLPTGVEKFIVQALLGQNQQPPRPGTLTDES